MSWKDVFKEDQTQEKEEKEIKVNKNIEQVSLFPLFLLFEENKNHNLVLEKLKSFLGEYWDDYKDNPKALKLWVESMPENNLMQQGIAPEDFTATT